MKKLLGSTLMLLALVGRAEDKATPAPDAGPRRPQLPRGCACCCPGDGYR